MANDVFANMREIACKAASGKSICAFPDVCFTPPQAPPTPPGVPIPYPNTAQAGDTTKGTKKVKISGKEVLLKNSSCLKSSVGNEAGNTPKKGLLTSKNKGKGYFNSWSMDVKFEGKNVARHLDLVTHNHGSTPGNTPPWAYIDSMAANPNQPIKECKEDVQKQKDACAGKTTRAAQCADEACSNAKKCMLVTYNQGKRTGASSQVGCCPGEQPHHLVEAHCFYETGGRGDASQMSANVKSYDDKAAPCVCASGPRHAKKHGQFHAFQGKLEAAYHSKKGAWSYGEARDTGVKSQKAVNPQCSEECTKAQLDAYHKKECGARENTRLRADPQAGTRSAGTLSSSQQNSLNNEIKNILGGTSTGSNI